MRKKFSERSYIDEQVVAGGGISFFSRSCSKHHGDIWLEIIQERDEALRQHSAAGADASNSSPGRDARVSLWNPSFHCIQQLFKMGY
jgi:hypothetical protein